jgi:hypothetical protein
MLRRLVIIAFALATILGCTQQHPVKNLQLQSHGLTFKLGLSKDDADKHRIVGKLVVLNIETSVRQYGNFRLTLDAQGEQCITRVDAPAGTSSMVDERLIALMPGDSLEFFAFWTYTKPINFARTTFELFYTDSIDTPELNSAVQPLDTTQR